MIITRMKHHKIAAVLLAVAAATFTLAGCSGAENGGELKSGNVEAASAEWNDEFGKCMKDKGFNLSNDNDGSGSSPNDSSDSSPKNDPENGEESDAFNGAVNECFKKVGDPPADPNMPSIDEINEQQLAFAKCMRNAGHDYPDPKIDPQGGVVMSPAMPAEWQEDIDMCSKEANMMEDSSTGGANKQ